ncbi:uncharacterized protein LOC134186932 isoform X2 [Corticium candelabrum]|nr:uncharacterized protein LOC134186932 isoform X2 [Corticium candelabrum]
MLLGSRNYVFPLIKNRTRDLKMFNTNELSKVLANKVLLEAAKNRTKAAIQRVLELTVDMNATSKDCTDRIEKRCPQCVSQECKRRAETVCPKPNIFAIIELLAKEKFGQSVDAITSDVLYPAEDFFDDSADTIGNIIDTSWAGIDHFFTDILPGLGNVIPDVGNIFPDLDDLIPDLNDVGDVITVVGDIIIDVGDGITLLGNILTDVGDGIKDIGDLIPDGGDIVKDVGEAFTIAGDVTKDVGDVITAVGEIIKGMGDIKVPDIPNTGGKWERDVNKLTLPEEPTCDDLQEKPKESCKRYIKRPECKASCNPTRVCPKLQTLTRKNKAAVSSYKAQKKAFNKIREMCREQVALLSQQLAEIVKEFCWLLDFISYYNRMPIPSRPWYNITKILISYNTATGQIVQITVSVDIGSDKNRYIGDLKVTEGFGDVPVTIAREALQWYKEELANNNACQ